MSEEQCYGPLCTFAATGPKPHFQGIYLCHTCSNQKDDVEKEKEPMPLCICYNCAEKCHEELGHEVDYVGDGPSY